MKSIIIFIIIFGYAACIPATAAEYAVARSSTPVLNSMDFKAVFGGASGHDLKTDRCGQVRELEYIALPGTVFTILKKHSSGTADIYEVKTEDYSAPPNVKLYVDGLFLKHERSMPQQRRPQLAPREEVVSALKVAVGAHYVWGGNVLAGVPELAALYDDFKSGDGKRLTLAGLDCSGLLYHATGGWTPRNTSQLITFGRSVEIADKQPYEIVKMLQPLDLIVWNGHVIIVIDQQTTIESRLECGMPGNGGVVISPLSKRIADIIRTRRPVNVLPEGKRHKDAFVVRRWYPR